MELSADDSLVVDVSGQIVLPGLIDSHVHAWEGAIRGIAPGADFGNYMAITHGGIAKLMTPGDIAVGQRVTAAQALNGGVTTIGQQPQLAFGGAFGRLGDRRAALDLLFRAVQPRPAAAARSGRQLPGDLLRLREAYFSSADQLLTMRMFDMPQRRDLDVRGRAPAWNIVAEMGMWIEDLDALLASGLSREGHTYNHCAGLDPRAVATQRRQRSPDQHGSPLRFAVRPRCVHPLYRTPTGSGCRKGISCDNELSYGDHMFTEMRTLATVQRGLSFGAEFAGEPNRGAKLYGCATRSVRRPPAGPRMLGSAHGSEASRLERRPT